MAENIQDGVLLNTKDSIRNITFNVLIYSINNEELSQKSFTAEKIIVSQIDILKKMDIFFSSQNAVDEFEKFLDLYYSERQKQNTYLSFVVLPDTSLKEKWVMFVSGCFSYFEKSSTVSGDRLFTTVIDDDSCIWRNDEKFSLNRTLQTENKNANLTEEEISFITDILQKQESPEWFPTKKEYDEEKRRIKKNRKLKSPVFGTSKKETETDRRVIQVGEQEFINPKSLKMKKGSKDPESDLKKIIGLENIKEDISDMQKYLQFKNSRKSRGVYTDDDMGTLHMCFMGNPGTGKTTVARIMTGILYKMGYIKENKCLEINGLDLIGGYVGQTGIITKKVIDMARGGILFVDEAYSICGPEYGKEAVSVLLKEMEDNRNNLVVIFAGYEEDINKFLNINSGFRSRINKYFNFVDYKNIELAQILMEFFKRMHLKIDEKSLKKCFSVFYEAKRHTNFSNGRFARNMAEQIEENHILNVSNCFDLSKPLSADSYKRLDTVISEDIPEDFAEKMIKGI